jgi:hypothetical protein
MQLASHRFFPLNRRVKRNGFGHRPQQFDKVSTYCHFFIHMNLVCCHSCLFLSITCYKNTTIFLKRQIACMRKEINALTGNAQNHQPTDTPPPTKKRPCGRPSMIICKSSYIAYSRYHMQ